MGELLLHSDDHEMDRNISPRGTAKDWDPDLLSIQLVRKLDQERVEKEEERKVWIILDLLVMVTH